MISMDKTSKKKKTVNHIINRQVIDKKKIKKKLIKRDIKKERLKKKEEKKGIIGRGYRYKPNSIQTKKTPEEIDDFIRKVRHEKAKVRIGKNGINEGVIKEIKDQVEREIAVKVQILKNCPIESLSEVFSEISSKSQTELWRKTGRTGIFVKSNQSDIISE